MSVATLLSRAQLGTAAPEVTIEVFLSGGLPSFSVVGMPETLMLSLTTIGTPCSGAVRS